MRRDKPLSRRQPREYDPRTQAMVVLRVAAEDSPALLDHYRGRPRLGHRRLSPQAPEVSRRRRPRRQRLHQQVACACACACAVEVCDACVFSPAPLNIQRTGLPDTLDFNGVSYPHCPLLKCATASTDWWFCSPSSPRTSVHFPSPSPQRRKDVAPPASVAQHLCLQGYDDISGAPNDVISAFAEPYVCACRVPCVRVSCACVRCVVSSENN